MMSKGLHLNFEGLKAILAIYAAINRGISKKIALIFPNIIPVDRPDVLLPPVLNPY
jgi:hypothetical protein